MNRKTALLQAALVAGLLAFASNASAALVYFDSQIVDIPTGKASVPANTVMCDPANGCAETEFTAAPYDPVANPTGNWTQNNSTPVPPGINNGTDNVWNQRFASNFGNPDPSGNGTVYEARGTNGGPNTEDPPVLKTTINVPMQDQGTVKGVYALFWTDSSSWQIAASLEDAEDEFMPVYVGNTHSPTGHVFGVYDVGAGDPSNLSPQDVEMNGLTSTDSPGGRRLKAAWLGNVELGPTLSVFVGDGPPLTPEQMASNGGANSRTWYDGIAYGDVQDLERLPIIPEPASAALFALGLSGIGLFGRRRIR